MTARPSPSTGRARLALGATLFGLALLTGCAAAPGTVPGASTAAPAGTGLASTPGAPTGTASPPASGFRPLVATDEPDLVVVRGSRTKPDPADVVLGVQAATRPEQPGYEAAAYLANPGLPARAGLSLVLRLPAGARVIEAVPGPGGVVPELDGPQATWRLDELPVATTLGPFWLRAEGPAGPVTALARWEGGEARASSGPALDLAFPAGPVRVSDAPGGAGVAAFALDPTAIGRQLEVAPAPGELPATPAAGPTAASATATAPANPPAPTGAPTGGPPSGSPAATAKPEPALRWLTAVTVDDASGGEPAEAWLRLPLPEPALPGQALTVHHRPLGARAWLPLDANGSVTEDGFQALLPVRAGGTYALAEPAALHEAVGLQGDGNRVVFLDQIMRRSGTHGVAAAVPEVAATVPRLARPALNLFVNTLGPEFVRLRLQLAAGGAPLVYACGIGGCLVTWDGPEAVRLACPLTDEACQALGTAGPLACNNEDFTAMFCRSEPADGAGIPALPAPDACRRPCVVDRQGRVLVDGDGHRPDNVPPASADRGVVVVDGVPIAVAVTYKRDQSFDRP